jgi:hypothetical protein
MGEGAMSGHRTRTGTPMGTPHYMSPEQCRGQNVYHRTDIYSFGMMAQAHRRQYYLDKRPEDLREAIREYREYLTKVEQGGRRADAAEALAELEPTAARLEPAAGAAAAPEVKPPTRLMVSSQTKGASVVLDGGAASGAPLIGDVKPGKHVIHVAAPGFFDEEREVLAAEGSLVAVDIPLREKPARVSVEAASGAQVAVDGRPAGTTPLASPLELASGRHLVTVTRNGSRAYSQEIDVARAETRRLAVPLETTSQRYLSYVLLTTGAAGLVAGGVFTGVSFAAQKQAKDIGDARAAGNITLQQLDDYNAAVDRREAWKKAAGVAFGAGAAVGAVGLLLFAFDQPRLAAPPMHLDEKPRAPEPAPTPAPPAMEMSAVPVVSPGFLGGAVSARF